MSKEKIKINIIKMSILTFLLVCITQLRYPLKCNAAEYTVTTAATPFKYGNGMVVRIPGRGEEYLWCVQRGVPFRSAVSELQFLKTSFNWGSISGSIDVEGLIPEAMRYLQIEYEYIPGVGDTYISFRGWGIWSMNSDKTDAVQTSTSGAPSSLAWQEAFDEDGDDNEDSEYEKLIQSNGQRYGNQAGVIKRWVTEMRSDMTGHEGCIPVFTTAVKPITAADAGFGTPDVYAFAILNHYIFVDPDAAGYSNETKWRVEQILSWAVQFDFITTIGGSMGFDLRLIYSDSSGYTKGYTTKKYSGSCDGYVKLTINNYEDLKLYRQVVWKTTNMRSIPSFASENPSQAEPIKLYWDEELGKYTATVADQNGVLDYFDFSISGCEVTNNGDGTLTISTSNRISGTVTSSESISKLEPADGVFKLPDFYRWSLEGTTKTLTYTTLYSLTQPAPAGWDHRNGILVENGIGRKVETGLSFYIHSHDYSPACNWFCERDKEDITHCTLAQGDYNTCVHDDNAGWDEPTWTDEEGNTHGGDHHYGHNHTSACHTHYEPCYHSYYCPYYKKERYLGCETYVNTRPLTGTDACEVTWCCGKFHYDTSVRTIDAVYVDWQDFQGTYLTGRKIIDPTKCYIKVQTVGHEFPAETDTEILLIADNDEWNDLTYTTANGKIIKHSSHLRVGEKYHLKYIYSYKGASKGFRIVFTLENKPYYQYNYLARMQEPHNVIPIYELRTGLAGDRFSASSINVPHAKLVQDLTDIKIRGIYATPETAYTLNGVYSWDSGTSWNDKVYLDALVTDQYDDNYDNKSPGSITSTSGASELKDFSVTKPEHNKMIAVWEFDTEPEVFTSALVYGTAYIEIGDNKNYTKTYYDEAYNYSKDKMTATQYTNWFYNFEEHNNVGGVGYFSSEYVGPGGPQSNNPIPNHTVYTQNNEYLTYAIRNKVWQSDIDIKVSNFVQNTGAGITEHIYQERGRDNHDINYNLYYTIDVENPKATIYAEKQRAYDNGRTDNEGPSTTSYDTSSDVYEFDVNNMISWGSTGASQTGASYGNTVVVDHIKTGRTYIQREIPTILATMTAMPKETMSFRIYPNYDRLIYEDHYTSGTVSVSGSGTNRKVIVSFKDGYYPSNEQSYTSDIFPAMNPNFVEMQPQNINNSNNIPDEYNQGDNALHHIAPTTSFNITLSNGETKTIVDSHTKTYTQYDFEYNPNNRNNKVTFPSRRKSIMFFKYSKTNYSYNGNSVQSGIGEFRNANKTQTESYYISQVLFKSNYTSKYKKELEAQGADYIEEFDAYGNLTNAWIDMANQNKFAIVAAGQGFELKVVVKYENSLLTQYLSRYFGEDDGQNDIIGTSNRVQKGYLTSATETNRQFANISSLTGKDGRVAPFYKDTERAYISSNSILDRLAVNLVTGANVFNDLYVFMSDNPDTIYSYSGIYDTPVVFERNIKYSDDFAVTTVTYSMCVSHENGISSNLQKMRFYTNQLAPDKRSPGIVEGTYDVMDNGEHSITIWTPIVAATPFDYPSEMQERYIGDAIELGYTIKTTGADDAIVHIVQ